MLQLTFSSKTDVPWIDLAIAALDSWPLLLDDRSMQELKKKEPHLLNREPSSQGQYMTEAGKSYPMPTEAVLYFLKSVLGPDIERADKLTSSVNFKYRTSDGETGIVSVSSRDEFDISNVSLHFSDSPQGRSAEWELVRKIEKHIEDRRDQIAEYREQHFGAEPKPRKPWLSFRR